MEYETQVLTTKYQKPDAYGALSMPVYYTAAFEFPSAKAMNDAFCGRSMEPSYARIANPTTTYLEERVRQITGATSVTALNTGMAAIAYALTAVSSAGLNIVASKHLFGNSVSLIRDTLGSLGVEPRFADFTKPDDVKAVAPYILEHRLTLTSEAKIAKEDKHDIIRRLISKTKIPL